MTYRKPNVNRVITPIFLFALVLSFQATLMGMNKRRISVRMLNTPLAVSTLPRLRQTPGTFLFHIFTLGVHWKIFRNVMTV